MSRLSDSVRDIAAAFSLLTVVPTVSGAGKTPSPATVAYFPWVGLALGALAVAPLAALASAGSLWSDGGSLARASLPLAAAVVGGWALLTRMLHWDGLADVADAWWGGADASRRLEIMADPAVGAFGTTAVALAVVAQVASIATLLAHPGLGLVLLAVPVFGRTSALFAAWLGRAARPGGLGGLVIGRSGPLAVSIASAGTAAGVALPVLEHGAVAALWAVFALVVAAAVPHAIASRFGGVTGDVMGASVAVTETVALLAAALLVAF